MNTRKNYGYKVIDTKMKEAYFDVRLLDEDKGSTDACYRVWSLMNVMAVNNIGIQQLKAS